MGNKVSFPNGLNSVIVAFLYGIYAMMTTKEYDNVYKSASFRERRRMKKFKAAYDKLLADTKWYEFAFWPLFIELKDCPKTIANALCIGMFHVPSMSEEEIYKIGEDNGDD